MAFGNEPITWRKAGIGGSGKGRGTLALRRCLSVVVVILRDRWAECRRQ